MSEQPVGEWPDVSMPVAVRRVDANARALAEIRALCEPVLTEYVDDGEPVLAQAILDVIRGSR